MYGFLIAYTHYSLWKERGFLDTKGTPIVNGSLIAKLLKALQQPAEVAIIHCRGHQTSPEPVAWIMSELTQSPRIWLPAPLDPNAHPLLDISLQTSIPAMGDWGDKILDKGVSHIGKIWMDLPK